MTTIQLSPYLPPSVSIVEIDAEEIICGSREEWGITAPGFRDEDWG